MFATPTPLLLPLLQIDKKHKWDLTRKFNGDQLDLALHTGFTGRP
jgi:hypothetical protein